jgi:hypothetical protein
MDKQIIINQIKKEKTPSKGTKEGKKREKGSKSKQKTIPYSAECTMGSPKRRNHET